MCGIAGIIHANHNKVNLPTLKAMTDIIAHRGPDGEGHWVSDNGKVALGHRRLSIIDLSHNADQPMHYLNRYTITFNGEIYNYIELKEELIKQGYNFKTVSDTEVLMTLYHKYKESCLDYLDGMFAFCIYDKVTNEIFVARDRFGEKPFFYAHKPNEYFYFGSELKCLWAAGIPKETDNIMLYNFLSNNTIENPDDLSQTFFLGCKRLPHSHFIKIKVDNLDVQIKRYYTINYKNINYSIDADVAANQLTELFTKSVSRRLRSDVAVGSSLSGGLDSSLVVCIIDELKKGTNQKQKTFSAEFPGFLKNERKYQDCVIKQTSVSPYFVTPTDDELLNVIEKLNWHQEEPYGSASIFVQYKVMQLAKQNDVTVLLDGQGADEILAGYHFYYNQYFNELRNSDKQAYKSQYNAYVALQNNSEINEVQNQTIFKRLKFFAAQNIPAAKKIYKRFKGSNAWLNKDFVAEYDKYSFVPKFTFDSLNESLHYSTMQLGLQELLRYADRNSMAHSREVRLPFLNHELVEFLFTLPPQLKINQGWTKWIMRKAFENTMPHEITWRKDKIGYEPPQQSWMQSKKIKEKLLAQVSTLQKKSIISTGFNNSINTKEWPILMTELV